MQFSQIIYHYNLQRYALLSPRPDLHLTTFLALPTSFLILKPSTLSLYGLLSLPSSTILYTSTNRFVHLRSPQSLEISSALSLLVGPMTPQTVYLWYTLRVDQILSESSLFDNAAALIDLAIERLVPLHIYKCALKIIENAVSQLNFKVIWNFIILIQLSRMILNKRCRHLARCQALGYHIYSR